MSMSSFSRAFLAALLLWSAPGGSPPRGRRSGTIDLGGLILTVSSSRTAQVFHIVDQLSAWDQYAHRQYLRWAASALPLDSTDRALLRRHAALRRARGWGGGFEQAFLVEDPIPAAAARAVSTHLLTPEEATAEQDILEHFAPRLTPLMDREAPAIDALIGQLHAEAARLRPLVEKILRFSEETPPIVVPVFLVSNPDTLSEGGEANGGRLVVEVPGTGLEGVTLHESLHFLLNPHADAIRRAADSAGLSFNALNEGIAYALAPGLIADPTGGDVLAGEVVRDLLSRTPPTDPYAQAHMVAIVIRPILTASLDSGTTITDFLPRATARWKRIARRGAS